ncbi:MAG: hypothetical protein WCI05_02495 [Myxococcales bacterium]
MIARGRPKSVPWLQLKRPSHIVLDSTVTKLAPGGDGVAFATLSGEQRAIFVRGVAPGDAVRLEVDASRRPARGRLLEVLQAGPGRVVSACEVSGRCGGCDWMHLSEATQADAHESMVRNVLPWEDIAVRHHGDVARLGYRTRARLHVQGTATALKIGMHAAGTHEPVQVARCVVLDPRLEEARHALRSLLSGAHGQGEASLALGPQTEPRLAVLDLKWDGDLPAACFARFAESPFAGIRLHLTNATVPMVFGDPTPWMQGADGAPLRLSRFGQASESTNVRLAQRVAELADGLLPRDPACRRVVELFAGAGNFSVVLAPHATDLVAVEADREACLAARENLRMRGLKARVVEADAMGFAVSAGTRLVVLDPPRTGARAVAARLVQTRVRGLIYVSCDLATLGRDLSILACRYVPVAVETFAMFPQTSHVEVLVALASRS